MNAMAIWRELAAQENAAMRRVCKLQPSAAATRSEVADRRAKVMRLARDGMTQVQIADHLGVKLSTVKSDMAKSTTTRAARQ